MQITKTTKINALKKLASGKTTRVELAKKYNIHPSTFSKWKKGTEFEKLPKISRTNKVSTSKKKATKATKISPFKRTMSMDSYEGKFNILQIHFNGLKKKIASLYKISLLSQF